MDWTPLGVVAALVVALGSLLLVLLGRRTAEPAALQALEVLSRSLGQIQADVARHGRVQDELRAELNRGREAWLRELAQAAEGIRGEIEGAQRALAEVKAVEHMRTLQLDRATDSLHRLEAVVAGSASRGAAGESILARALTQLPPDLLETNAAFEGRVVEYALRLPGGRLLPIDSKWTSAASLERLEATDDTEERRRLREQVAREVRTRVREMGRYLDPERTLALGVVAVPDAVHAAAPETHAEGWRDGVLVVPYSLALPFVLSLYRLAVRFASAPDGEELSARVGQITDALGRMDDEVEGRLSRALVQAANARDALRGDLARARHAAARLAGEAAETELAPAPGARPARFDPPRTAG